MLLRKGREKALEKRNVVSLDLNTVTESLLTTTYPAYLAAIVR